MTEKAKESISALVDEEISEIELHRLLRQYSDDPSIKEYFVSYQEIRSVVRGENSLNNAQHIALHSRICEAVDNETVPDFSRVLSGSGILGATASNWSKPALGLAMAASLVLAVFVGFNVSMNEATKDTEFAGADTDAVTTPADVNRALGKGPVVDAQTVSAEPGTIARSQEASNSNKKEFTLLRELDEEKQKQLRLYLNQHDRSRMNPYERTVNFKQPAKKN